MHSYLAADAQILDHRRDLIFDRRAILAAAAEQTGALAALGVARGDRIALGHGAAAAFIADLFAIWSLGATALVVSPGITAGERENIVASAGPKAWIGGGEGERPPVVKPAEPIEGATAAPGGHAIQLDDVALIMMTSGTTSRPKGVMITHRAIQARLALNTAHIGGDDLAVSLNVLPMHFGHGLIGNCLTPLYAGALLVAWPEPGVAGLPRLGAAIDSHRVTFMSSVPSLWRAALKLSSSPQAGSLRRVHVGSAPLSAALWREIIAWCGTRRVVNMYGITETSNWIGGANAEAFERDDDFVDGLVGWPWGGRFGIVGPDGTIGSVGRGEVAVNSPSLMAGYYQAPTESGTSLAGDWLRTGDIGELGADGSLRLVGRLKHEINRGGIKVPAEEIDLLLERHPDVAEACAFALDDPLAGEIVAAAVVLRDSAGLRPEALVAWSETMIRREAVPGRVFVLDALPKTARGKINRDEVRAACEGRTDLRNGTGDGAATSV